MHEIKVTHKKVWDIRTGLGLQMYISSIQNPIRTPSSSLCQMLNKETVGLIPVIGLWLLTQTIVEKKHSGLTST